MSLTIEPTVKGCELKPQEIETAEKVLVACGIDMSFHKCKVVPIENPAYRMADDSIPCILQITGAGHLIEMTFNSLSPRRFCMKVHKNSEMVGEPVSVSFSGDLDGEEQFRLQRFTPSIVRLRGNVNSPDALITIDTLKIELGQKLHIENEDQSGISTLPKVLQEATKENIGPKMIELVRGMVGTP